MFFACERSSFECVMCVHLTSSYVGIISIYKEQRSDVFITEVGALDPVLWLRKSVPVEYGCWGNSSGCATLGTGCRKATLGENEICRGRTEPFQTVAGKLFFFIRDDFTQRRMPPLLCVFIFNTGFH